MASITTDPNGNRTLQFVAGDSKRRSIRLGKVPFKLANEVKLKVEALNTSKISGMPLDGETARWVARIGDDLADKLEAVGLISKRDSTTLGKFLREYIDSRTDLKSGPKYNLEVAMNRMLEFFDADLPLREITPADGDRWAISLRDKYAEATAARTLKHGRQFLHAARRARLLDQNVFEHIKPGSMANADRLHFVTKDDAEKMIAAAPCVEWRAIIALARYGGLRTPSETLELTWGDVLWDQGKFRVRSPKLEKKANKGIRWVPIFPELRPHLEALFDAALEGSVHLINRYRSARQNLRTQLERIMLKAGVAFYEKPFQNMRSSRETELTNQFPLHVVTSWLGNSALIAAKHYLQVTDQHFEEAVRGQKEAVQNPVQSGVDSSELEKTGVHDRIPEVISSQ